MARITDRYASAVHSSNLKVSKEADKTGETGIEDTDTLGAFGLADRDLERGFNSAGDPVRPAPLAVPLERLFAGDNNAVYGIVRQLASMAFEKSFDMRLKISKVKCTDLARACLAWYRNGVCTACGGHGYSLIPGVPSLSGHQCQECSGTGKIRLVKVFSIKNLELAQWLVDEIARESGRAGPQAMKMLADRMELP